MAEKTKVDVLIDGKAFTITGYESDEYIQRVGLYVDRKMNDVIKNNNKLSTSIAAILTALNVGDDYFKAHENELNFKKELLAARIEIDRAHAENAALQSRNQDLIEKNNHMQIQLAKRDAELAEVRNSIAARNARL